MSCRISAAWISATGILTVSLPFAEFLLVLAIAQLAGEVDVLALLQGLSELRRVAPDHDAMPLRSIHRRYEYVEAFDGGPILKIGTAFNVKSGMQALIAWLTSRRPPP